LTTTQKNIIADTEVITYFLRDGILHMIIKPVVLTMDNLHESLEVLRNYKAEENLLVLLDPTDGIAPNRKERKMIIEAFTGKVTAKAVISKNLFTPIVVNFMVQFESAEFTMKLFKSTDKAIEWLNTFK